MTVYFKILVEFYENGKKIFTLLKGNNFKTNISMLCIKMCLSLKHLNEVHNYFFVGFKVAFDNQFVNIALGVMGEFGIPAKW